MRQAQSTTVNTGPTIHGRKYVTPIPAISFQAAFRQRLPGSCFTMVLRQAE